MMWTIRQNPSRKTDQKQMREWVLKNNLVTCPYGHFETYRENVIDGTFNEKRLEGRSSNGQDRQFIEDMQIGDYVVIAFKGDGLRILAQIVSEPIYQVDTGTFYTIHPNGNIQISNQGDTPFQPVSRRIEIIKDNLNLTMYVPIKSLSRVMIQNNLAILRRHINYNVE